MIIPEENRKEICKYLFQGVSNCYVFKSRLQEYAQKVGFPTPVYETVKEGPSHEPSFRSTVVVNDVRYDSLPGFSNRKAAEQSAAEVALVELSKSGEVNHSISVPVHETGLCKNLLQEYAQKMNYAIPLYQCQKEETPGRVAHFSCTVEIGGMRYIGTCAKTKKEAEIKAARTALLAIQSSTSQNLEKQDSHSDLTVIPFRKRTLDSVVKADDNIKKFKKVRFQKRVTKRRRKTGDKAGPSQRKPLGNMEIHASATVDLLPKPNQHNVVDKGVELEPLVDVSLHNLQYASPYDGTRGKEAFATNGPLALHGDSNVENGASTAPDSKESYTLAPLLDTPSLVHVDTRDTGTGENDKQRVGEINFEPADSCAGDLLC